MFALRRAAARALSAPSKTLFASKPRSISTFTPIAFRSRQQQWTLPAFQRRFASDIKSEDIPLEERTVEDRAVEAAQTQTQTSPLGEDAPQELFSQTAVEAPIDEDVTPVAGEQQESTGAQQLDDAVEAAKGLAEAKPAFSSAAPPPNQTLYIGNLNYRVTEEQLRRVFSRFGPLTGLTVVKKDGLPRGFAYVDFEKVEDAQAAIENLDMQVFEGRNMVVQFSKPKSGVRERPLRAPRPQNPPSKSLYIGNMSFQMTDNDLNDLFRNIRNVLDVRVAIDRRTGAPRGFAHADFLDVESAVKAKEILDKQVIYGRNLRIDFSQPQTPGNRNRDE